MKYGQTLLQQSIPEWGNYNVDYNDLKHLIKVQTTRGQGQALTIPGHDNERKALQAFESDFFAELAQQHQRVNLFVQSKAGEISRRLSHLNVQIGQLHQRYAPRGDGQVLVKRLEKFSKFEETVEKAGEEIKSLSRFVGAQKLAFNKLMKKYKRWTGSPGLDSKFKTKVLNQSNSLFKADFEPLLTQYNEVLTAVRASFENGLPWSTKSVPKNSERLGPTRGSLSRRHQSPTPNRPDKISRKKEDGLVGVAAEIQKTCQKQSDVEFDTALAILPLGRSGGKASYWVHPENLVGLHVLLLQYTRLRKPRQSSASSPASPASRRSSRLGSSNGNSNHFTTSGGDDVGIVVCDDLLRFSRRQSGAPIKDSEESSGKFLEKAALTIRYGPKEEALVAVDTASAANGDSSAFNRFQTSRMKAKVARQLFDTEKSATKQDSPGNETQKEVLNDGPNGESTGDWLAVHQEVKPLVCIQSKRTRFSGLRNSDIGGVWATLDKDCSMKKWSNYSSPADKSLMFNDADDEGLERFPFALLEVRFEGGFGMDFISALDETHLTERVRGFSIETHAVAMLCKPEGMAPPLWLSLLHSDIRKLPATVKTATSRLSSAQVSPDSASLRPTSTSATSVGDGAGSSGLSAFLRNSSVTSVTDRLEAPPLSTFRKKRRIRRASQRPQPLSNSRKPVYTHYWNEYDDGDEASENEPFAIYVDPNKSSSIPGMSVIIGAAQSIASRVKSSTKTMRSWPRSSDSLYKDSGLAQVDENTIEPNSPDEESEFGDSPIEPLLNRSQHRYATFPEQKLHHAFGARESLLFRSCITSFLASFALLVVAALLATTGRRKAYMKVEIGVIMGVVFSLVFATAGVVCMYKRNDRVSPWHRVAVFMALAIVCVLAGILLGDVLDG